MEEKILELEKLANLFKKVNRFIVSLQPFSQLPGKRLQILGVSQAMRVYFVIHASHASHLSLC